MLKEPSRLASVVRSLATQTSIAVVGVLLGIILLAFSEWPNVADVLKVGGTALVAACLSMLLAMVSSREAVRRQNARDAHLRAKGETYSPLNADLKALHRGLEQAKDGTAPYPLAIKLSDREPPRLRGVHLPIIPELTFTCWEEYKLDARELDFTPQAAQLLDSIGRCAREYNATVQHALDATIPILSVHIQAAIRDVQQAVTPDGNRLWLTWHAQFSDRQRRGAVAGEGPLENAWYAALVDDNAAEVLATTWVTGATYATSDSPRTLGWLLMRKADRAAKAVLEMYTRETYFYTAPPEWVEGIIRGALPDLIANAGYEAVWAAFKALLAPVQEADAKVLAALRAIREQYEGGPPLV